MPDQDDELPPLPPGAKLLTEESSDIPPLPPGAKLLTEEAQATPTTTPTTPVTPASPPPASTPKTATDEKPKFITHWEEEQEKAAKRRQAASPPGYRPVSEQYGITNPYVKNALDFLEGGGGGAGGTLRNINEIIHRAVPQVPLVVTKEAGYVPPSLAGQLGKGTEQVLEFAVPGGAATKVGKAVKAGKIAKTAINAALQAGTAAGVTGAQTGGDLDAMKWAALFAGGTEIGLPLLSKAFSTALGATTQKGGEAVRQAIKGSPEFTQAMRGQTGEQQILGHLRTGLETLKNQRQVAYQQQLAGLAKNQVLDLKPLRNELLDALKDHRIKYSILPNGKINLDFTRSTVGDPSAERQIKRVVDNVWGWGGRPGDFSPMAVDTLKRRLGDALSKFGDKTSSSKAFIGRLRTKTADLLGAQVPNYKQMTADYEKASNLIRESEKLVPTGDGSALRQFSTLMKDQGKQYQRELIGELSKISGRDLLGEIAGSQMKSWLPSKAGWGMGLLEGAAALTHMLSPWTLASTLTTSPRLVGEAARLAGKTRPLLPAAAGAAGRGAHAMVNPDSGYARGGLAEDPLRRLPNRKDMLRSLGS